MPQSLHDQITQYLSELAVSSGISLGNDNTLKVLSELENPHTTYDTIHIGGTNGKGSTTVMLATALSYNMKVGCYTSPHLIKYNERIAIYDHDKISYITDDELYSYLKAIELLCDKLDVQLTEFEILTIIAFWYFKDMTVDVACIEVGLGGRYDTTNIIDPIISIITNVSLDHTDRLGKTITEIAKDKAGIIKPNIPVITGAQNKALDIIKTEADKQKSQLYTAKYSDIQDKYDQIMSYYQKDNLPVVLTALDILSTKYNLQKNKLISQLSKFNWPGRYEHININNKLIILDGAHNPDGMKLLLNSLSHDYPDKKISFLIGFLADKEWQTMTDMIIDYKNIENIYVMDIDYYRNLSSSSISEYLSLKHNRPSTSIKNIFDATKNENILCVCGSLYLVGQIKKELSPK